MTAHREQVLNRAFGLDKDLSYDQIEQELLAQFNAVDQTTN